MQKNLFKQRLLARQQQIGIWSMLASANVLEVMSQSEYDWLMIDTEHSPNELPMVLEQLRTVRQTAMPTIVRPSTNDVTIIKRLLDIGAQTLLVPMVDTVEEAERALASTRYPTSGIRGVSAGTRANHYGKDTDYFAHANNEVCLILQIESVLGLSNLEQIAALDGVDALFIGPGDLAAALGHLGQIKHPDVQVAIRGALTRCHAAGKPMGILMADPELAAQYVELGFDFVAVATDISILRAGAEHALNTIGAKRHPH